MIDFRLVSELSNGHPECEAGAIIICLIQFNVPSKALADELADVEAQAAASRVQVFFVWQLAEWLEQLILVARIDSWTIIKYTDA